MPFSPSAAWDAWAERWNARLVHEPGLPAERAAMTCALNPFYISRNHLVGAALNAAVRSDDYRPSRSCSTSSPSPTSGAPASGASHGHLGPEERVLATFCDT